MKLLVCTQKINQNDPILGFFVGWVREFAGHFDCVDVICLEKGEYDLPDNVHVRSLGKEKGSSKLSQLVLFYIYFASVFFRRPQYIFFHMGAIYNVLAAPFFFLRFLTGTKFYWWKAHGGTTGFEKLALFFSNAIYTPTDKSFPVDTRKKRVVGHAVDTDIFAIDSSVKRKSQALFVGRIMPVKRLDIIVDIAANIDMPIHIVGPADDGEYKRMIDEKITAAGLGKRVEFVGEQTGRKLAHMYQEATVVINPSETGSVDKVVLEAMACGTPVVALEETYDDILGQFNLTVPTNDAKFYADLINAPSSVSPEDLRSYVVREHSLHTLPQRIFDIK